MPPVTHALLLTAGLGTRLRPLTLVRAKPALPVAGEPMVRRIIRWLAWAGVSDVVLNLHHLPQTITAIVGDGSDLAVRARYSWEQPHVLGTAGGPRQALDIVGVERFLIVNGDTLTDVGLQPLIDAHAASGALVTMAVVPNKLPGRYGGLRVDAGRRVTGVEPKGSTAPSWHFVGVQVAEREAFETLPRDQVLNSVGGTYAGLNEQKPGAVRVFECSARFWDIGTVADYWHACHTFAATGTESPVVDQSAHLHDCIVWDDVEVGAEATLERCIITDGVRVPSGAAYRDSVLIRDAGGTFAVTPIDPGLEDGRGAVWNEHG
jgi:NDP-sugar pyrophosphorylase family protein